MPDPNARDTKLIQYMNEAYGNEKELEVALVADIAMTTKAPYKKRLQQHLKETKGHARDLERRIKKLGGSASTAQSLLGKATAVAKGPLHMVRGDGAQEKMLKNAKTQYLGEHGEISTYLALENFATKVGDRDTANLARAIRREEERMATFLESQIRQLSAAVATEEIPATQRRGASKPKARKAAKKSGAKKSGGRKKATKKATAKKARAKKSPAKRSGATKKTTVKVSATKSTAKKSGATSAKKTTTRKATEKKS